MSEKDHEARITQLEHNQSHFKEHVEDFKKAYKEDSIDNKESHIRIEKIARRNSEKLDEVEAAINQAKGGFKVLGVLIDASVILSLVVASFLGFVHWAKDLFHK